MEEAQPKQYPNKVITIRHSKRESPITLFPIQNPLQPVVLFAGEVAQ